MTYTTLISAPQLEALRANGTPLMVFDCSFELADPHAGAAQYRSGHIPGAVYAHLDNDLSALHGAPGANGAVITASEADTPASGGRHPLPSREKFAIWLSSVGFDNSMQAVVYDRQGSAFCGRLWWMLKWLGHDAVAVLDGALPAWQAHGGELVAGDEPAHFQSNFRLDPPLRQLVSAEEVLAHLEQPGQTLIDARAAARFRGEAPEPRAGLRAGHIPGAKNVPYATLLNADATMKSPAELRAVFEAAGVDLSKPAITSCGSGVTAAVLSLALERIGHRNHALYDGSWAEWGMYDDLAVEKG